MQLKSIAAIIVLLLVLASLSVAGCTSSSNTANKATITPLAADNLAGAINDRYKALNYTVKTPFTMTKQDDKITYHGVIEDQPLLYNFTFPLRFNVTIVLTTSSSTAEDTYSNLKSTLKENARRGVIIGHSIVVVSGSEKDSEHPGTYEGAGAYYRVAKFDPTKYGAVIATTEWHSGVVPDKEIPLNSGDMSNYYEILTVE